MSSFCIAAHLHFFLVLHNVQPFQISWYRTYCKLFSFVNRVTLLLRMGKNKLLSLFNMHLCSETIFIHTYAFFIFSDILPLNDVLHQAVQACWCVYCLHLFYVLIYWYTDMRGPLLRYFFLTIHDECKLHLPVRYLIICYFPFLEPKHIIIEDNGSLYHDFCLTR